jgi:1-deoxy-D-xylulose-5-phosphate synthase
MTLLDTISEPGQLAVFNPAQLETLAAEIRRFLVEKVTRTGGHLGPNRGVVELTIALHRVFDSPKDILLFDTGHQAYVHKILTGRHREFGGLRQAGGLSGYPSRQESEHDIIGNSHASTAMSYAYGLAKAMSLDGADDRKVVVVVGDGTLTGGMRWEALNNIGGAPDRPVIIVLNDNGRSYDPTVGAVAAHLADQRRGGVIRRLFGSLGLAYLGPVDGHDTEAVERALRAAARLNRPAVVHCVPRKGHGYALAEANQADRMHGIGVIDPVTGRPAEPAKATWTSVFAEEMAVIGQRRPDIVCLTAAMLRPVGPYRLPVTFVLERAGVTGEDGPSHHGMWDLSLMQAVPGLRIAAPRDPQILREVLYEAVGTHDAPTMIRWVPSGGCFLATSRSAGSGRR